MKKVTIEAYNRVGEKAVKIGEREVDKPDTLEEARRIFSEEVVLKGFWKSYVIGQQCQIRSDTSKSEKVKFNQMVAKARVEAAKDDPTLLNMLIEHGIVKA